MKRIKVISCLLTFIMISSSVFAEGEPVETGASENEFLTETNVSALNICGINADTNGIILKCADEVTGEFNLDGVLVTELESGNEIAEEQLSTFEKNIYIKMQLEKDVIYKVVVSEEFGNSEVVLDGEYVKTFCISDAFYDNFESYTEDNASVLATELASKNAYFASGSGSGITVEDGWFKSFKGDIAPDVELGDYSVRMVIKNYAKTAASDAMTWNSVWFRTPGHHKDYYKVDGVTKFNYGLCFRNSRCYMNHLEGDGKSPTYGSNVAFKTISNSALTQIQHGVYEKDTSEPAGFKVTSEPSTQYEMIYNVTGKSIVGSANGVTCIKTTFDTMADTGYFQFDGTYSSGHAYAIDEFEITKCVILEEKEIIAESIDADREKITITFDSEISAVNDFSYVEARVNGALVDAACSTSGNMLYITPEDYNINNTYTIEIATGFGTVLSRTVEDYTFSVTPYDRVVENMILLDIEGVYADSSKIVCTFSSDIGDVTDFSGVHIRCNDEDIPIDVSASSKILTISVVDGLAFDTSYELYIEYFENDLKILPGQVLKEFVIAVPINGKFNKDNVTTSGKIDYTDDGKMCIHSGSWGVNYLQLKDADNYSIEFDYQLYSASMCIGGKDYSSVVPYASITYNADKVFSSAPSDGNTYYFCNSLTIQKAFRGGTLTEGKSINYPGFVFGDAYEENGKITLYKRGDTLPVPLKRSASNAELVTVSERDVPPVYHMRFEKRGKNSYIYRDEICIASFEPTDENAPQNGYFNFLGEITEIHCFDNIKVTTCVINDKNTVKIGKFIADGISSPSDILNSSNINGTTEVKNYLGEAKDTVVAVLAYGKNNELISAWISDEFTLKGGGIADVPYTLSNTNGAESLRTVVWESVGNLTQYSKSKQLFEEE